jgi:hypothetical protein
MFSGMYGLTFQGETTNNPNKSPDPLNMEKPNPEPTIVYMGQPPPKYYTLYGLASHVEISRRSDTRYNYDASIRKRKFKVFHRASKVTRYEETSHGSTHRIKVTKVESILYEEPKLSTANLLVIFESNGREEAQWFKYAQFERLDGAQEAVERFKPAWK